MSKKVQFNPNFWSAVKRKNLLDVLKVVFAESGHDEAAQIAHDTTRFTGASIVRMMNAVGVTGEPEEEEEAEDVTDKPEEGEVVELDKDAEEDFNNHLIELNEAIDKAIKKGKKKKAIKLIKESEELGVKGSVLKDQEKQAKAL